MNPKGRNPKNVFKKTRTLLPSTNKYQEKLSAKVKSEKKFHRKVFERIKE